LDIALLHALADDIAAYESAQGALGPGNLAAFYAWQAQQTNAQTQATHSQPPQRHYQVWELAKFTTFLFRFARYYSKPLLEHQALQTADEFAFVAELVGQYEATQRNLGPELGLTKAELSDRHLHERTTGMEIIARLVHRGFIKQTPSLQDKRAKILTVTALGRQAFVSLAPVVAEMGKHIAAALSEAETQQLLASLERLNAYHRPFFMDKRGNTLTRQWHNAVAQSYKAGQPQPFSKPA